MCSIIGYLGDEPAAPLLVKGIRRMEYRGYDSAGIATLYKDTIVVRKGTGKVAEVNSRVQLDSLPGNVGIGHTRWATHGGVTQANAHPHVSTSGQIAIVHNGIIDNHAELRETLIAHGYHFSSETDSEVIANLLDWNYQNLQDVKATMLATIAKLQGNYSFAAIFPNGTLAAARFHEPLIVGIGKHGYFVASDILGFVEQTDKAIYIDNLEMLLIDESGIKVSDFTGAPVKHEVTKVSNEVADVEKGDYVHYTLKEIFDQPNTILKAGRRVESDIAKAADIIKRAKTVYITGSGSSFHAALVGKYLFSKFGGISVEPIIASEARFYPVRFTDQSVVIAMSQSGESADVLESVSLAKDSGATIISLVNVMSSSLAHLSKVSIGLNCGPEIGVAATKSFTAQLAVLYKIADEVCGGCIAPNFELISDAISTVLANHQKMKELVANFTGVSDIYVLGMGIHYSLAAEASLKLKELAYVHAEALPGGELKHGPLALLDPQAHVIIMNPADSTYQNVIAGAHEVKARGAKVIGISDIPNDLYDYWIQIPSVEKVMYPLVEIIPAQLLAYYLALHNNANPDYPRNLAKSVTVK